MPGLPPVAPSSLSPSPSDHFGPGGLRQPGEVARLPQVADELRVRRRDLALLVQRPAELPDAGQRLHVVAADLAGHVAVAAELAFERDVHDVVVHLAPCLA